MMVSKGQIRISEVDQFMVGESDFSAFDGGGRCRSGIFMLCTAGSARLHVNNCEGMVAADTTVMMLPGAMVRTEQRSADFRVRYFAFSREMFAEASFRMNPSFFQKIYERPITVLPDRMVRWVEIWFEMAGFTYDDRDNVFRITIMRNRLQNLLLDAYDKMRRNSVTKPATDNSSRQGELFDRFISLVHEHCGADRGVKFYADRLCISTRYLSTIVRRFSGSKPKAIIDESVLLEVKMLLDTTDLSVQEIAYRMHFPDQSYLGRFFKKMTGDSPTAYRAKRQ